MAYTQLAYAFACRSQTYTWPQLGFLTNPTVFLAVTISALLQFSVLTIPVARPFLEVTGHPVHKWVVVLMASLFPVTVIEVGKLLKFYSPWNPSEKRMLSVNACVMTFGTSLNSYCDCTGYTPRDLQQVGLHVDNLVLAVPFAGEEVLQSIGLESNRAVNKVVGDCSAQQCVPADMSHRSIMPIPSQEPREFFGHRYLQKRRRRSSPIFGAFATTVCAVLWIVGEGAADEGGRQGV